MSSAARTNLTSQDVELHTHRVLGEGSFRIAYEGTYIGGNRNRQAAACKCFKPQWEDMEHMYFADDFDAADTAIRFAEEWNRVCPPKKEILITKGDVKELEDEYGELKQYLVEPLIRDYVKFTSNSGWINPSNSHAVLAMEAFSHFTYHQSGGGLIVCDLQGRYKKNSRSHKFMATRFELTDVAISSRQRRYGLTDLGEKGIEQFFHNHTCNQFCQDHWQRPRDPQQWFEISTSGTSMFSSQVSHKLTLQSGATFRLGLDDILEEGSESDFDY